MSYNLDTNFRIDIVSKISNIIYNHPELRVGQILSNIIQQDPYYVEDKDLLDLINKSINGIKGE